MPLPAYDFEDFKAACAQEMSVFPIGSVLDNARDLFNLNTSKQLLDFIVNEGLEGLEYINTKVWENNPNPDVEILVDSYEFKTLGMLGYISFFYNDKTKKWLIKSFHLSNRRSNIMLRALEDAGLIDDSIEGVE